MQIQSSVEMNASDESSANSSYQSEDELIKELLDDESPLFLLPKTVDTKPGMSMGSVANKLLSTIYSGPTIEDIKNALSMPHSQAPNSDEPRTCRSIVVMDDKGLNNLENKYTLKVKSNDHAAADDGYKWRKYGQKSIKNRPHPRSYYRCTNPRCGAKKQVERSTEDPNTLVVTYEGLHLHFTYSHFLPTIKPPKRTRTEPPPETSRDQETPQAGSTFPVPTAAASVSSQQEPSAGVFNPTNSAPQGLLEDVVRLIIRRPLNNSTASSDSCFHSTSSSLSRSCKSSSLDW